MSQRHVVTERAYQRQPDGRTVLAAVPGDEISMERARELGLVGGQPLDVPPVDAPYLLEGVEPREGAEADARATGDTAEAQARRAKKARSRKE